MTTKTPQEAGANYTIRDVYDVIIAWAQTEDEAQLIARQVENGDWDDNPRSVYIIDE